MQQAAKTLPNLGRSGLVAIVLALFALTFSASSAYAATQIEESWIQGGDNVVYNGAIQDPITIKDPNNGYETLTKYSSSSWMASARYAYKVEYSGDCTNAGAVSFTVTGGADAGSLDKRYSGTVNGSFEIKAADLANAKVSFPDDVATKYAQTGDAITPKPQVTLNDGANYLPASDYKVSYRDSEGNEVAEPKTPGTYTVVVSATSNNVTGENATLTFQIIDKALDLGDEGAEIADIDDQQATGAAIEPDLKVTLPNGTALKKGIDYTVSYENNVHVGTATATVKGAGIYAGTLAKTFNITQRELNGDMVSLLGAGQYTTYPSTGSAVEPEVSVVSYKGGYNYSTGQNDPDGPTLKAGEDYTVEYTNNNDVWLQDNIKGWWNDYKNTTFDAAKQPSVTITGKGDFRGAVTVKFNITPTADLSRATIRNLSTVTFDGKAHAVTPSDFGIKFTTLTQNGGAADCSFGLQGLEGKAYDVSYKDADGKAIDAKDVVNAGTYTMVLTGKESGGFTGTKEVNFNIEKADFSKVAIANVADGKYTKSVSLTDGKAEPDFNLTLGEGDDAYQLVKDQDYTVKFQGNDKAGTARATITPKGNFAGDPVTLNFTIRSAEQDQAVASLKSAINQAKAVEQGKKSTAAYNTLQAAIKTAEAVDSDKVDELNAAQKTLEDAVSAFNNSADVTVLTGTLYNAKDFGTDKQQESHAAGYFSKKVEVAADGDAYDVDIALTEAAGNMVPKLRIGATDGEGELTSLGNGIFRAKLTADQLAKPINLGMYVHVEMNGRVVHAGWQQAYLVLSDADATAVAKAIDALPAANKLALGDAAKVTAAKKAYDALTPLQKALVSNTSTLTKAQKQITTLQKAAKTKADAAKKKAAVKKKAAAKAKAKKQATVTVNTAKVTAKAVDKAVKKAGSSKSKVKTIVLGKKVKSVSKKTFAKYKKVTTIQVTTKKLSKKSVKGSLKGSKVKTVKVNVGGKKTDKTYAKKYQKIFTKANAGKKVKVTR